MGHKSSHPYSHKAPFLQFWLVFAGFHARLSLAKASEEHLKYSFFHDIWAVLLVSIHVCVAIQLSNKAFPCKGLGRTLMASSVAFGLYIWLRTRWCGRLIIWVESQPVEVVVNAAKTKPLCINMLPSWAGTTIP